VLTACGGSQPRSAQTPVDPWEPHSTSTVSTKSAASPQWARRVSAARPDISIDHVLPDLHDELRWPLSAMSHPELAPRFDIASVFAQPGVGWIELCERGVDKRVHAGRNRDELAYLRGWCSAIKEDPSKAVATLAPLMTSATRGLASAVRVDLVNVIANAGDISLAEKLLNENDIDDIEIFDRLAATYVELGRERDAYEMNRRALDALGRTTNADHCVRLARGVALGGPDDPSLPRLAMLGSAPKAEPTCQSLALKMKCVVGTARDCEAYFAANSIDPHNMLLIAAYRSWPTGGEGFHRWTEIVHDMVNAAHLQGSKELATVALGAARKSALPCDARTMAAIRAYIQMWPDPALRDEMVRCRFTPPTPLPIEDGP